MGLSGSVRVLPLAQDLQYRGVTSMSLVAGLGGDGGRPHGWTVNPLNWEEP